MAWMLVLMGCGEVPTELILRDRSSVGTYTVSTEAAPLRQGEDVVPLFIESAGEPALGLRVEVEAWMDEMAHAHAEAEAEELGEGDYAVPLLFTMAGAWTLSGALDDGLHVERFSLRVEVR